MTGIGTNILVLELYNQTEYGPSKVLDNYGMVVDGDLYCRYDLCTLNIFSQYQDSSAASRGV
eukprot:766425-Hanusia_phi.AAC.3